MEDPISIEDSDSRLSFFNPITTLYCFFSAYREVKSHSDVSAIICHDHDIIIIIII